MNILLCNSQFMLIFFNYVSKSGKHQILEAIEYLLLFTIKAITSNAGHISFGNKPMHCYRCTPSYFHLKFVIMFYSVFYWIFYWSLWIDCSGYHLLGTKDKHWTTVVNKYCMWKNTSLSMSLILLSEKRQNWDHYELKMKTKHFSFSISFQFEISQPLAVRLTLLQLYHWTTVHCTAVWYCLCTVFRCY